MIVDYHIHPNYSQDAEGTIEEYCAKAISIGIDEICFTPHFEIDPKRQAKDDKIRLFGKIVPMRSDWIDYYFKAVQQARKKFPDLKIKAGLEIGYDPTIENELKKFCDEYPFDFILGAIHCLNHFAITDHRDLDEFITNYSAKNPREVAKDYFIALTLAVQTGLFNSIAHFDVYKKYLVGIIGPELFEESERYFDPVLKLMAQSEVGIEINTAGLRQNPKEIYPAEKILLKAKAIGVKIFTIGSDAHRVDQLGYELRTGYDLARRMGLTIYRFEKKEPIL